MWSTVHPQKRESRSHTARRYERRHTGGWSVFVVESDGQGRPAPEYAASPVLSVTWGDAHTRLRFPKNGVGDGGAMTSRRISVTRLRHLQPSAIVSLLKKGLVYDTGRKRWCRNAEPLKSF